MCPQYRKDDRLPDGLLAASSTGHAAPGSIHDVRDTELNRWWRVGLPLVAPFVRLLFRVRVEGTEHVPLRGPAVLAFDHVSVLDGPVLAVVIARRIRRESRFLVAAEIFRLAVIGRILRAFEQIPIRRGEGDADALDIAIAVVRSGALAAIAPEGRVSDDPEKGLQRVRTGVARISMRTGTPVIPVGVWGTHKRWPRSGIRWRRPWRPRVGIAFGSPILPAGEGADPDEIESFTRRVGGSLARQVARAREMAGD
jgi:1-acyl-sn-glycerol-3-phosphate acyltransferase